MWHREHLLRRRAPGRQTHNEGDAHPAWPRVREDAHDRREALSQGSNNPSGHGQPEHAFPVIGRRTLRERARTSAMESLHPALHTQTWKLAEPGRNRDWTTQPTVHWSPSDGLPRCTASPRQSLESLGEPDSPNHRLEIHQERRSATIRIQAAQNQAVPGLVEKLPACVNSIALPSSQPQSRANGPASRRFANAVVPKDLSRACDCATRRRTRRRPSLRDPS